MSTYAGVTNCDSSLVDEIWHVKLRVVVVVVVLKTVSFLAHPVYAIWLVLTLYTQILKHLLQFQAALKVMDTEKNYIKTSR